MKNGHKWSFFNIIYISLFGYNTVYAKDPNNSVIKRLWCNLKFYLTDHADSLLVLGFNDTPTLVGHFVSSPREREKKEEIVEEMRGTGKKEEQE